MSIRETIINDIETVLVKHQDDGTQCIKAVYRAPKGVTEIARTAFPVAILTSADEFREDVTLGGPGIRRIGTITYWIDVHVWGDKQDHALNMIIEAVEDMLDLDRTRGGVALDTRVREIRLLSPNQAKPVTGARIFVDVDYDYIRGNS